MPFLLEHLKRRKLGQWGVAYLAGAMAAVGLMDAVTEPLDLSVTFQQSITSPESRLIDRLPKPAPDGRTELVLSPLQLLERIARFVPPPRVHRHRYHGVLAPNARLRAAVVDVIRSSSPPSSFTSSCPTNLR